MNADETAKNLLSRSCNNCKYLDIFHHDGHKVCRYAAIKMRKPVYSELPVEMFCENWKMSRD